jgi:hypothetical protein
MKKIFFIVYFFLLALCTNAHVGSPGVTYEGNAGPYKILVNITPPDVIPGTASVTVYLEGITKDVNVSARSVYWFFGDEGSPRADEALAVAGEPGRYDANVWLMSSGSASIQVIISGPQGEGTITIPVIAVSTAQRDMPPGTGWGLFILAVFLVVLMITIVGSSVSDGLLKPGEMLSEKLYRKRYVGASVALVILVLTLWGGKTWWDSWAARYQRFMFHPLTANTSIEQTERGEIIRLSIDTTQLNKILSIRRNYIFRKMEYLIPDHGKLMHLFLVKAREMNVFAHLHPVRKDSVTFEAMLPPLPNGKYWVYADITRLSSFSETITDTIEISERNSFISTAARNVSMDGDDTYLITNSIKQTTVSDQGVPVLMCGKPGIRIPLQDGTTAIWEQDPTEPLMAGKLIHMRFSILEPDGSPSTLQPYLGMMGHAVIVKDDGSVYIHLHPTGNYSMGSQRALLERFAFDKSLEEYLPPPQVFMDSIDHFIARLETMPVEKRDSLLMIGMNHTVDSTHAAHSVTFPYAFPEPGNYRIWIQMKRNNEILNSAFDAQVN